MLHPLVQVLGWIALLTFSNLLGMILFEFSSFKKQEPKYTINIVKCSEPTLKDGIDKLKEIVEEEE